MNFVNIHTGTSHNRSDLCCKAGVELELLLKPAHSNFKYCNNIIIKSASERSACICFDG